jgi:2-aminoethylphosphonate-pyruvate transaminase
MSADGRMRLLNPGPVTLSPRVRRALAGTDLCHREPDFARLQADVRERLARVYPEAEASYAAVLLTGSGTAAVEAMLGSFVPPDGKALVVANGAYGERMTSILQLQGKAADVVRSTWTRPMDLEEVARKLAAGGYTHVAAVHHETTTGRLNDIAGLGALGRRYGVPLLLDVVSSFGGERIDFDAWNVEACAATANKCLHGVPGVCFVLARQNVFTARRSASASLYLDLFRHYQEQARGYPAFTPAVQSMYALRAALAELDEQGGWQARRRHYRSLSRALRAGLGELGVALLLEDKGAYSSMLSSFVLPEAVCFASLFDRLKQAGFVIYPGQQVLEETIFRVAVMGDLSRRDLDELLRAFTSALAVQAERCP